MNHPDEPLDPREEALVRALHAQAETVRPTGDGLVRIRERVERRRSRTRWVVPTASAAAVAATVTAVVASGVFTTGKQSSQLGLGAASLTAATTPVVVASTKAKRATAAHAVQTPVAPAASARVVPSVTDVAPAPATTAAAASVPTTVAADNTALQGPTPVWPFVSADAAASWQKTGKASEAWHLNAVDTATHFVNALKLTGVVLGGKPTSTASGTTATVTLQRTTADRPTPFNFATVELSKWAPGSDAPWGVVAVTSSTLTVNVPTAGSDVSGSLQVSYDAPGLTEGQVEAKVYSAGTAAAIGQGTSSTAGTVAVTATQVSGAGFVVVTSTSGGGATPSVGSLAVVPVQLTASAKPTDTYVALVSGKIEVLDTQTGAVVRTLAPGVSGITSVARTEDGSWVWFATPNGIFKTVYADATGTPTALTTTPATYVSVAGKDTQSWASTYVSPTGAAQSISWTAQATTGAVKISDSLPPEAETLAIAPDGKHLASWVKGGNQGTVEVFTLPTDTDYSQGTTPAECSGTVACAGATYAPDGDLFLATTDGAQISVVRDHLGKATPVFTVAATTQTVGLDVDASGTKVLVVPKGGQGFVWDGQTLAKLPAGVTDASW